MDYSTKIEYIEAINSHGTISRAAEKLYISQPYLSKVIKNIEDELNTVLFERIDGHLRLTYSGRTYLRHILKIADIESSLEEDLNMITNSKKGSIKIGINPALGGILIPEILPKYRKSYPNVEIKLYEENGPELENLLEKNILDFYISIAPVNSNKLETIKLFNGPMYLFVPSNSTLYEPLSEDILDFNYPITDLNNETFILMPEHYQIRSKIDEFFLLNDLAPTISLETNTLITAISLSKNGLGATLAPVASLGLVRKTGFTIYSLPEKYFNFNFVLVLSRSKYLNPSKISMINMIRDHVKEL